MIDWQELDRLNKNIWQGIDFNLVKKRILQINHQIDQVLNQANPNESTNFNTQNNTEH